MKYKESIKDMKKMMESIFTYGTLTKENKYLDSYRERLPESIFNLTFDIYSVYLKENCKVMYDVYTDSEGCTYNSLVRK